MKTISLIALVIFLPAIAPAMSFWTALAEIESGGNDYAVGNVGEISRYQIRPEVWSAYSSSRRYHDPAVALAIAKKYMAKLKRDFERATGRTATESDCVILWKSGITGYEKQGFNPARMSVAHQERIVWFRNLRGEPLTPTQVAGQRTAAPAMAPGAPKPAEVNVADNYFFISAASGNPGLPTFGNPGIAKQSIEVDGFFTGVEAMPEKSPQPRLCLR